MYSLETTSEQFAIGRHMDEDDRMRCNNLHHFLLSQT